VRARSISSTPCGAQNEFTQRSGSFALETLASAAISKPAATAIVARPTPPTMKPTVFSVPPPTGGGGDPGGEVDVDVMPEALGAGRGLSRTIAGRSKVTETV